MWAARAVSTERAGDGGESPLPPRSLDTSAPGAATGTPSPLVAASPRALGVPRRSRSPRARLPGYIPAAGEVCDAFGSRRGPRSSANLHARDGPGDHEPLD